MGSVGNEETVETLVATHRRALLREWRALSTFDGRDPALFPIFELPVAQGSPV